MLHISHDCPLLLASSIVSIVYLLSTVCSVSCVLNVTYIPGLSFIACPFECLYRLFITYSMFCVLCTQCSIYPRIVLYCLPLRLSLSFTYYLQFVLCLVYSMLLISQDCPLLLAHSNVSIVYLLPTVCSVSCVLNVTYIPGKSFIAWLFEYLYRLFITHRLFCVLCTQCCLYLRSVHSWLPLRMFLSFIYYLQSVLCLVYSMFHISQDCPLLLASSIVSIVYLLPRVCYVSCVLNVPYIPGLSFIACLFGSRIVLYCCLFGSRIVLHCVPLRSQDCPLLLASSVPGLSFIACLFDCRIVLYCLPLRLQDCPLLPASSVPGLSFIACLFGSRIVLYCLPLRLQDCPLLLASSIAGLSFIACLFDCRIVLYCLPLRFQDCPLFLACSVPGLFFIACPFRSRIGLYCLPLWSHDCPLLVASSVPGYSFNVCLFGFRIVFYCLPLRFQNCPLLLVCSVPGLSFIACLFGFRIVLSCLPLRSHDCPLLLASSVPGYSFTACLFGSRIVLYCLLASSVP